MIVDESKIYLTSEEEQATHLPVEFTWKEAGFRHRELMGRSETVSETMRQVTGHPAITIGLMGDLAIEQYRLSCLAFKLEKAMIERAYSQMELGGVITRYATARQQPLNG